MEIVDVAINELTEYENNPRINDESVPFVANSIKEFGFLVPCVIDADKTIIAGHTRLKAARRLGMKTVPCIYADKLTPEQVKAFRLADNKVGEKSEWKTLSPSRRNGKISGKEGRSPKTFWLRRLVSLIALKSIGRTGKIYGRLSVLNPGRAE